MKSHFCDKQTKMELFIKLQNSLAGFDNSLQANIITAITKEKINGNQGSLQIPGLLLKRDII